MVNEQTGKEPGFYEEVKVCPLEKVMVSDEALLTLEQYSDIAHEQVTRDRALRRVEILRNFAGHDMPEWCLEVAALAELAERAADEDSVHRNSRRYINRYRISDNTSDFSRDEVIKALAALSYVERELGADSRSTRRLAQVVLEKPEERLSGKVRRARSKRPAQNVDTAWNEELNDIQLADPEKMLELTNQMLFVPLLVKAAHTLDMLKNRREITKTEAKRYMKDALEVYIPFCETIGYDNFAQALNNAAQSFKVESQKNYKEEVAEAIKQKYEKLFGGDSHLRAIAQILDGNSETCFAVIGMNPDKYGAKLGSFTGNLDGVEVDGRYRVKGMYALISKFFSKGYRDDDVDSKLPMDMLGITLITQDREESAAVLGKLLQRVAQDDLTPMPTVERREKEHGYIHIQGTDDFINGICRENGIDRSKISSATVDSEDFEVAKLTFMTIRNGEEIPTEVQIITRNARDNGRRGLAGHMLHKLFGKLAKNDGETRLRREETSIILQTIHDQKKMMKNPIPITTTTNRYIHSFTELCRRAGV